MMALKLASLARGASGVRWSTLDALGQCLAKGLVPVVPSQGSVGASGDLAPLAHLAAAMLGIGEIEVRGVRLPAATALTAAGLAPIVLGPKEGLALLNGTQFSTACALAGLFEAESLLRAALSPARYRPKRRRAPTHRLTHVSADCDGIQVRSTPLLLSASNGRFDAIRASHRRR